MPAPWVKPDTNEKPNVKELYEKYVNDGLSQKDAAKLAQQNTGVSVVTGRVITKKVEFSATGKAGYSGEYPSRESGPKRWKPAAWPK